MPFHVPDEELRFRSTRSRGPGGQHVNKASTRVEVLWDLEASGELREAQRARLRRILAARLDARGRLRVASDRYRSQHRNREDAAARLRALVAEALRVPKKRKPTRPPKGAVEERLRAKRERSERKRQRGRVRDDE